MRCDDPSDQSSSRTALGGLAPKSSIVTTDLANRLRLATEESRWVRYLLIGISLAFLVVILFVPLAAMFAEALRNGLSAYFASFTDAQALSAIRLTLFTAAICVTFNLIFGLAASWAIAKFDFPRQEHSDLADRFAVCRVAGHFRLDVGAAFRHAGLARSVAR